MEFAFLNNNSCFQVRRICFLLLVIYATYLVKTHFYRTEGVSVGSQEQKEIFWSKEILLHYVEENTSEFNGNWALFSDYCFIHGCQHVIVEGNCGFNRKMCKRLTHLGVAKLSRTRTLFVDNDIVPRDQAGEVFDDLCGREPFSIGCRFGQNLSMQRKTNSGIMCINVGQLRTNEMEWISTLDTVGRCQNGSATDQYAFYKPYAQFHDKKRLHCINEQKYGARNSKLWPHYWGESKEGMESAITESFALMRLSETRVINPTSTLLIKLANNSMKIDKLVQIEWEGLRQTMYEAITSSEQLTLLSDGWPSYFEIERNRKFLMPSGVAEECKRSEI
ncbi:hypothetical protein SARC_12603 [Sphaeroforma arctica JP610]|uniref:Uncharacterized protein n=1 Tax=Sphaeroforma arctica JP610 TaxID=667725 RepID=A0A0L0FDL7_9EUKA|nr:hypothetical protein SARC_12603 [Sphaeroforma arctica JP610]KNC74859.1 hypothetical protein SARC_12603 [Sphaeroforma arctica JP610]|eukprot:XP_014148761.1 hypothetical protein SARC_12603 [Sphaeroforma arctica JP610]